MTTVMAMCSRVIGNPVAKAWISGDGVGMRSVPRASQRPGRVSTKPAQASRIGGGGLAAGAGALFLGVALQLAAGGEDVAAARRADRRSVAGAVEDRGERLDGRPGGALILAPRPGVERDQVDLG